MARLVIRSLLTLDGIALLAVVGILVRYGWTPATKSAVLVIVALTMALGAMLVVTYKSMRRRELIAPPAAFDTRATVLVRSYTHPQPDPEYVPRVRIEAEVSLPGQAPVPRSYRAEIPYLDVARFAPGVSFPCLVDPANLDEIRVYPRFAPDDAALTGEYVRFEGVERTVRSEVVAGTKPAAGGRTGTATVVWEGRSDSVTAAGDIAYVLKLSVRPTGAAEAYTVRCRQFVPARYVERVVPGTTVRCDLDPADRRRIDLDFSTAPAVIG